MMRMFCFCGMFYTFLTFLQYHVSAQNVTEGTIPEDVPKEGCPMGASLDMERDKLLYTLFPGLFVTKRSLKPRVMARSLAVIVKSVTRRRLKKVQLDSEVCCEMVTEVIKPMTVQHDSATYDVVHLSSEEQLVTMTSCVNAGEACSSGRCFHLMGYDWILVWDATLPYYPPVKFIPMAINVGCDCQ